MLTKLAGHNRQNISRIYIHLAPCKIVHTNDLTPLYFPQTFHLDARCCEKLPGSFLLERMGAITQYPPCHYLIYFHTSESVPTHLILLMLNLSFYSCQCLPKHTCHCHIYSAPLLPSKISTWNSISNNILLFDRTIFAGPSHIVEPTFSSDTVSTT